MGSSFRSLLLYLFPLVLLGCNNLGELNISQDPNTQTTGSNPSSSITFAGITSIDLKTDSTLRINWLPHADAVAYDVFDATNSPILWLKTAVGQSSSSTTLTGLTPGATYRFIVRAKDSSWVNEDNSNVLTVTMDLAPQAPSSITVISPASPSNNSTPLIRVGGIKSGDTIRLYTNNSCTTLVASGTSSSTTLDLTTSSLAVGTHSFFATAVNASSVSSACSTATASYQVTAPSMPSALTLVTPSSGPSFSRTPTIRVSGVASGQTIKLFSNSGCTLEVASGSATGTTIDLTTSTLSPGAHTLYARSIDGSASPCSTSNVSYTVLAAFSGIGTTDLKTDSTVRLNWTTHASATSYEIYRTSPGSLYLATVASPGTSYVVSGLTPGATYSFMVKAKDSQGVIDWNTATATITMNAAPNVPSGLTLLIPSVSPGVSATPTIRVSGVKAGDTVKLFTDNTCATEVASGVSSGATIDLTTSALPVGPYTFYARALNSVPTASACSTASASYVKNSCPAGYIPVPANASLGATSEFCVMKFEAKNVSSVATSQAALSPWVLIDSLNSRSACTSLGAKYDLISNPEWMTIAYEIEKTASNWSGGSVGTGSLSIGHTDASPNSPLAVSNTSDPYDGTGNNAAQAMGSGKEQQRLQTLSNGETIWDFSGNVGEWVDWMIGGGFDVGPTTCTAIYTELKDVSCADLTTIDYMPANPGGVTPTDYTNVNHRLGQLYGGNSGYAVRSGAYSTVDDSGIFALTLVVPSNNLGADIGFRCVYRP